MASEKSVQRLMLMGCSWQLANAIIDLLGPLPQAITTDGPISPNTTATFVITKVGILAATLAAPIATTNDGIQIVVTSNTAYAHTLTATSLLQTGTAAVNEAMFAAFAGASLTLMAYQAKWSVISSNGVSFS